MNTLMSQGPTEPGARLESADAVRGFALFGVLLVNMYNFGAYSPEWSGPIDAALSASMHSLFETKSLRLFTLLFGLGFALQLAGGPSRGDGFVWLYLRRLAVLFAFGVVHTLLYDGDILMEYAMLGVILMAFRNVSQKVLLALAIVLLAVFPVANLLHADNSRDMLAQWEDAVPLAELRVGHPFVGSPGDVFRENAFAIPPQIWSNLHSPESSLVAGMVQVRAGGMAVAQPDLFEVAAVAPVRGSEIRGDLEKQVPVVRQPGVPVAVLQASVNLRLEGTNRSSMVSRRLARPCSQEYRNRVSRVLRLVAIP